MTWGLVSEVVRRARIRVSVAAWVYETGRKPIMTDKAYDELALEVWHNRNVATGESRLDRFFQRHFTPETGLWVHNHPNTPGLINIYARYHVKKRRKRKRH